MLVLLLHCNVMEEDETESLSVIRRAVTDHWPTHSSTHAGMLLLQIAPIDPLTFCLQSSSKVLVVWITQTWWEFKIQSGLFGRNNVLWNTWLAGLFLPRINSKQALHNSLHLNQCFRLHFGCMIFSGTFYPVCFSWSGHKSMLKHSPYIRFDLCKILHVLTGFLSEQNMFSFVMHISLIWGWIRTY